MPRLRTSRTGGWGDLSSVEVNNGPPLPFRVRFLDWALTWATILLVELKPVYLTQLKKSPGRVLKLAKSS